MIVGTVESIHAIDIFRCRDEVLIRVVQGAWIDSIDQHAISINTVASYTRIIAGGRPRQINLSAAYHRGNQISWGGRRVGFGPGRKVIVHYIECLAQGVNR